MKLLARIKTEPEVDLPANLLESANEKLAPLRAKHAELDREHFRLSSEIADAVQQIAQLPPAQRYGQQISAGLVSEVLGDVELSGFRDETPNAQELRARLDALKQRQGAVTEARELVSQEIARQRIIASQAICERLAPKHRALIEQMAKSLIAAHQAHRAYRAFADTMIQQDIAWSSMMPAHPRFLTPGPDGRIGMWLKEQVRCGHLSADVIPEDLR